MSRILLPLFLSTAAFAGAWWAGSAPSAPVPAHEIAAPAAFPSSAPQTTPKKLTSLARRSAQLQRTENPDLRSIAALMTDPGIDSSQIFRLAKIWADEDPAGLWFWLQHGGKEELPGLDLSEIVFGAWFRLDSKAAMAAIRAANPEAQASAARGLLTNLTGDDEAAKLKLVPYLEEVVAACGNGFSFPFNSLETMAMLMTLPPASGRDALLKMAGASWLQKDWKSASAWAGTLTEPLKSNILTEFARTAFRNLPNGFKMPGQPGSHAEPECFEWAKQWFTTTASPEAKRQLGQAFVTKLATTDPAAALDWAQDNLSARRLTNAMGAVLKQQAAKDPAAARALVEGLPPGGLKARVAFQIAGPPSAATVDWLRGQVETDPNYQWSQLSSDWAFKDPAAYRAYLESPASSPLPEGLYTGGFQNLVKKDGPGTLEWAHRTQIPKTVNQALVAWTQHDPAAAVEWALTRPAGAARDTSLTKMRESVKYSRIPVGEREALLHRIDNP